MKKTILIFFTLLIMITLVSSADTSYTFKQNEEVNFRFRCIDQTNNYCDSGVLLMINIESPNGTNILDNSSMTFNPTFFNHSLPTDEIGIHTAFIISPNSNTTDSEFTYEVTTTGLETIPEISGALIFGGILTLMFVSLFLLIIGYRMDLFPMKVFLIILAGIIAIINVGFVASSMKFFFSTNSTLSGAFGALYIIFIILITGASFFLIIWIIVTGFKLWKIRRGFFIQE